MGGDTPPPSPRLQAPRTKTKNARKWGGPPAGAGAGGNREPGGPGDGMGAGLGAGGPMGGGGESRRAGGRPRRGDRGGRRH